MGYAQRFQLRQVVQMFLFAATPVNGDVTVRVTRQGGQQNRAHIREARTTSDQDQRTVFVIAQPRIAVRNIHHDFTFLQDPIHHRHRIQVKL